VVTSCYFKGLLFLRSAIPRVSISLRDVVRNTIKNSIGFSLGIAKVGVQIRISLGLHCTSGPL